MTRETRSLFYLLLIGILNKREMKEIKLSRGYVALIDDDDYEFINQFKWSAHIHAGGDVVAVRNIKRNQKSNIIYMHRVIMNTPKELLVDHIDHNTLNNQKSNLRNCTKRDNTRNKRPMYKGKMKGVLYRVKYNNYRAYIGGKHIGIFETLEEAAMAYNRYAVLLYGEFAYLNVIPEKA